jgi:hypothetical protein
LLFIVVGVSLFANTLFFVTFVFVFVFVIIVLFNVTLETIFAIFICGASLSDLSFRATGGKSKGSNKREQQFGVH